MSVVDSELAPVSTSDVAFYPEVAGGFPKKKASSHAPSCSVGAGRALSPPRSLALLPCPSIHPSDSTARHSLLLPPLLPGTTNCPIVLESRTYRLSRPPSPTAFPSTPHTSCRAARPLFASKHNYLHTSSPQRRLPLQGWNLPSLFTRQTVISVSRKPAWTRRATAMPQPYSKMASQ